MKAFLLSLISVGVFSCSEPANKIEPEVDPSSIVKDVMSWLYYERDYMVWSADYVALDTSSNKISKGEFLRKLTTGKYFPIKIKTSDSSLCYQLYGFGKVADEDISGIIRDKAGLEYQYYEMEGKPFPSFDFSDLNGNEYSSITTKDKILVLNCWFINCQPCREEMPALNKLVDKLKTRKDILFFGLAFDSPPDLKKFLEKTSFKYIIIPDQKDYLTNDLRVVAYPTHLIISKQEKIVKVTNELDEMVVVLDKELLKGE